MGCKRYLMGRWKDPELLDYTPGTLPRATSQKKKKKSACSSLIIKALPGKYPQTLGSSLMPPSPRLRQISAAGDLRVSGQAWASKFGLLNPSPSKTDLSRFSFSEKEGDPITAGKALPHKAFCKEGQQGQLQQVTRSPLPKAAQALGVFYNLLKGKSKILTVAGLLRYHR